MRLLLIVFSAFSALLSSVFADPPGASPEMAVGPALAQAPQWYVDDIEFLTRGGGRWVADNSSYQGENEPFDAYGIEWKARYANSMTGRLFGIKDGVETGNFWEMFQYWDAGTGEAVVTQFGFGGAVGLGRSWREDGVNKTEQTFYAPDGSASSTGHKARNPDADSHETKSFDIIDGVWKLRRTYIWKREKPAPVE